MTQPDSDVTVQVEDDDPLSLAGEPVEPPDDDGVDGEPDPADAP